MESPCDPTSVVKFLNELAQPKNVPGTTINVNALPVPFLVYSPWKPGAFGNSRTGLGNLKFPAEILQKVLSELDVITLYGFRSVNRLALQTVDAIPAFSRLSAAAPDVLRAIVATRISNFASINTLYDAICTSKCSSCDDFGPLIYFLTCSRVCYRCLTDTSFVHLEEVPYAPVSAQLAREESELTSRSLAVVTRMETLPGTYFTGTFGPFADTIEHKLQLIDYNEARAVRSWQQGRGPAVGIEVDHQREKPHKEYSRAIMRALRNKVQADITVAAQAEYVLTNYRFMATVAAPWLDRSEGTEKVMRDGLACKACMMKTTTGSQNRGRRFTMHGFVRHVVDECDKSRQKYQKLSRQSPERGKQRKDGCTMLVEKNLKDD